MLAGPLQYMHLGLCQRKSVGPMSKSPWLAAVVRLLASRARASLSIPLKQTSIGIRWLTQRLSAEFAACGCGWAWVRVQGAVQAQGASRPRGASERGDRALSARGECHRRSGCAACTRLWAAAPFMTPGCGTSAHSGLPNLQFAPPCHILAHDLPSSLWALLDSRGRRIMILYS